MLEVSTSHRKKSFTKDVRRLTGAFIQRIVFVPVFLTYTYTHTRDSVM